MKMGSIDNGKHEEDIEESKGTEGKKEAPLEQSVSRKQLLSSERPRSSNDVLGGIHNRVRLLKFGSASAKFMQIAEKKDELSRAVPSGGHSLRERLNGVLAKKIDWGSLVKMGKEWIRNPMNMAMFVWILIVAISGAILFLVMTGMLNKAIPKKSDRDVWFEVNNQILNALFTLMCLYQHPKRLYHLVLLCRWSPKDISRLRTLYCKNGTYKPHEWAHMMIVVILLNLNCFAQYALCGLNLGYRRSNRPAIGVGVCISVAIGAPAIAGLYCIMSPLGKDYDSGDDEESQTPIVADEPSVRPDKMIQISLEKKYSFAPRGDQRMDESRPKWNGGILDFWDDISVAYLSLFCTFCVFGWNMERLGFGNMYVHIATFALFCMAPFWIFNLAAVNIDSETVRTSLSVIGIALCIFGLLYGGFWRIQMRKRFNLPTYSFCFGETSASDCALWLCCCWCSLAQEVRTVNAYDVVEDKFYVKQIDLSPLPREDGASSIRSGPSSPLGNSPVTAKANTIRSPSPTRVSREYFSPERQLSTVKEEPSPRGKDKTMIPPAPSSIRREEC